MLGRLARWLRLLGADVLYDPTLDGAAMLRRARAEGRLLLSADKRLRTSPAVLFIRSANFRDQLREVIARVPLPAKPLSRCSRCNDLLEAISPQAAGRRVPPFVLASQRQFACCPGCGRIYWEATHPERIRRELAALRQRPAGG